jgi:hypothetical protein
MRRPLLEEEVRNVGGLLGLWVILHGFKRGNKPKIIVAIMDYSFLAFE